VHGKAAANTLVVLHLQRVLCVVREGSEKRVLLGMSTCTRCVAVRAHAGSAARAPGA
jgi:hypothetical protein